MCLEVCGSGTTRPSKKENALKCRGLGTSHDFLWGRYPNRHNRLQCEARYIDIITALASTIGVYCGIENFGDCSGSNCSNIAATVVTRRPVAVTAVQSPRPKHPSLSPDFSSTPTTTAPPINGALFVACNFLAITEITDCQSRKTNLYIRCQGK